jgi:AcrR family transcriptional regulator
LHIVNYHHGEDSMREPDTQIQVGLRARKRADTRRRLHETAQELVLRDGFAQARLGDICSRADVAPRTFFNYFTSKEDAVIGRPPTPIPADLLEAHHAAYQKAAAVDAIIGLVLSLLAWPARNDPNVVSEQREVLRQNPDLLSWQVNQIALMRQEILPVIQNILRERSTHAEDVDDAAAECLLALCLAAIRQTGTEHLAKTTTATMSDVENDARDMAKRAIDTIKRNN